MKDRYIWGLEQQRPPHGSKYKLKLGGMRRSWGRGPGRLRVPESRLTVVAAGESHALASGAQTHGGSDGHPQQRHWPTRCHMDGQSSSSIVT